MADSVYYTESPIINGAPSPAPAAPTQQRRGLLAWQKFVICYTPAVIGGALLVHGEALRQGANEATALFVTGVALVIWLVAASLVLAWKVPYPT